MKIWARIFAVSVRPPRRGLTIGMLAVGALAVAGCAADFPRQGTASKFDGVWTETSKPTTEGCKNRMANGEMRYGYLVATAHEDWETNRHRWGQVRPDDRFIGYVGLEGADYAIIDLQVNDNTASGTWEAPRCKENLELTKAAKEKTKAHRTGYSLTAWNGLTRSISGWFDGILTDDSRLKE